MLSLITDHAARAMGRVISQFKTALRFRGLLTVVANEAQAVENALWDVVTFFRDPTTATGKTLDDIGALVGAPVRGARSDAQYRARVAVAILANRSNGEGGTIYAIARAMVTAWNVASQPKLVDSPPACYIIQCDPPTALVNDDAQARELATILNDASSAGVRSIVMSRSNTVSGTDFFRFAGGSGPAAGFGVGNFRAAYDK